MSNTAQQPTDSVPGIMNQRIYQPSTGSNLSPRMYQSRSGTNHMVVCPPRSHINQQPSSLINETIQPTCDHGIHTAGPGQMVTGVSSQLQMADYCAVYNNKISTRAGTQESGQSCSIDDGLFYPMKQPIGYALLLANDRLYPGDDDILNVSMDLDLMNGALNSCGWSTSNPYPDQGFLDTLHFDQTLRDIRTLDFADYSCFMFYYSGHGNEKGLLLSDRHCKSYMEIILAVNSNNSLDGKPKIFIFDSCRSRKEPSLINKYLHIDIHKIYEEKNFPSDTLVCYSATDGMQSYSRDDTGSFYTKQLVKLLDKFWERMTFTEIVTLTHGWTCQMARQNAKEQQPVMHCSLNFLLLLSENTVREELCGTGGEKKVFDYLSRENTNVTDKHTHFVYLTPKTKGPQTSGLPANCGSDVDKDAAKTGQALAIEFKTKQDVLNNLPRLGQGTSVFICYAPDPESPYFDPKDREDITDWYQEMIGHLIHDLERHGFTVISDLHLGEVQPKNWLQWYVSRIELCDYLIMVCSPAFKELFSCERPKAPIKDERTSWFLAYRGALYAEISKEVNESPDGSKYVPVILGDDMSADDSVPTLFAMAQKYQLGFVEEPRQFHYDVMGGFESLVCRMAGIDRMKLAKPVDQGVHKLAPVYRPQPGALGVGAQPTKRRRGYKQVPTSAATALAVSQPPLNPPQPQHNALPPQQVPPPTQHPPSAQYRVSAHVPAPTQLSPPTQPPPPSSLPDRPPAHSIILWLCQRITNWKFFARYLQMDGAEIERISIDNREDGVVNQRFQMFESWKRHEWRPYTYHTLGDVLMNNESNKHLYAEFCQQVMSAEQ